VNTGVPPKPPIESMRFAYDYPAFEQNRLDGGGGRFNFTVGYQRDF
jgi:hypothetical protein